MSPLPPQGVSQRSRRLVNTATGAVPNGIPLPVTAAARTQSATTRTTATASRNPARSRPPSEAADKETCVQAWLNEQPNSPASVPSVTQGPSVVRAAPTQRRQQSVVKRLFTSPRKGSGRALRPPSSPSKRTKFIRKEIVPFKRGRGSSNGSITSPTSPGTNWRKVPRISVTTTISPAKPEELNDLTNPNILIEVSTTSEKSPGKWNTVTYRNEISSPISGVWHVEEVSESNQDQNDVLVMDQAEPLVEEVTRSESSPLPSNRKRLSNIQRRTASKVRMVIREDSQPEFFFDEEENVDDPVLVEDTAGLENNQDSNDHENAVDNEATDRLDTNDDLDTRKTAMPSNTKRKRVDGPRANTRKRLVNSSKWKLNVAKKGFNAGTSYITSRGTLKKEREMKAACSSKCNRCERVILPEEREEIFEMFWALEDIGKKRDYISRLIDEHLPLTCSTSPDCAKKSIRRYQFVIGNEEVRVCKKMFLNTLGVPDAWVETTLKKITPTGLEGDFRGKHSNRPKKISELTLQSVRDHINLFPRVYSHYTRERTKREYLETAVHSVERMYKLYKEWAAENNVEKLASISCYRKVFNTEFNLGFFLPRKDQCELCAKWRTSAPEERRGVVQEYAIHLQNKKRVKALKIEDKANANESRCVACFDLQKVLVCPRSEVSLFFYHNKISLFNFTVFDLRLEEGHCYLWTEVDAAKGPNEIGTNLLQFIEKKIDEGVTEFIFYSDSPTGQNRNRMMFSLYLNASVKYNIKITHRFLESGHSYSEADSMHALIENEARIKQEIYTPDEWATLIKTAKQDDKPYIVNHMRNEEVLDLHALVNIEDWEKDSKKEKVFWSKVREIIADWKSPNCIFFRYNFSDDPSKIEVKLKKGGFTDHKTYKFPPAYTAKFPLPEKKKKDLRNLMRKGALPSAYHPAFEEYLSI